MPKPALVALVLSILSGAALAQDLSLVLAPDRSEVAVGDDLQVEVTLANGTDQAMDVAELILEDRSLSLEVTFEAAPGRNKTYTYSAVRPDPHAAERLAPARLTLKGKKSLSATLRLPALRAGAMSVTGVYKGAHREVRSSALTLKAIPAADGANRLAADVSTSQGDFRIDLLPEEAPLGVTHFVGLAKRGFYDGMNVQSIVKGSWFRTGCPYDNGFGHPGFAYRSEAESQAAAHEAGTVGLCQNLKGGFAGSQFFVNAARQQAFDKKFTVIGRVAQLDVVTKIAGLDTDKNERPLKDDVRIKSVKIVAVK